MFQEPRKDSRSRWRLLQRRGKDNGSLEEHRGLQEDERGLQALLQRGISCQDGHFYRLSGLCLPHPDRHGCLQAKVVRTP